MKFTLADIAFITHGQWNGAGFVEVNRIVTDSREIEKGDLFVAIKGENFDGHDFAQVALDRGAIAVVVDHQTTEHDIVVDDTLLAYGAIAAAYRETLNARVIAITGSSGKTSTKDLLAATLQQFGNTLAPLGSFNNEIGLPATVLSATSDTEYLVLEMGMRGAGHIDYLCTIAKPNVAALINVGSAHMELLGSREGIAAAKGEIFERLPVNGAAVLYGDDPLVMQQRQRTTAQALTFGENADSHVRVSDISLDEKACATFIAHYGKDSQRVTLQISGEHQVLNAAAVIAMCLGVGLDFGSVCAAVSKAKPASKWRMEVVELPGGITLINDSYNANPESMRAGLKALKAIAGERRSWAVLGEMRELGETAVTAHDEIGRLCVRLDISHLIAVGPGAKLIHMGAAHEGSWGDESAYVETLDEAIAMLTSQVKSGDVVFVKASRAIGLDRVAQALTEHAHQENTPL
jgi:UDP-N-acetylmuramoyl-tripeptide--D-alanyl-D-alanine ligase